MRVWSTATSKAQPTEASNSGAGPGHAQGTDAAEGMLRAAARLAAATRPLYTHLFAPISQEPGGGCCAQCRRAGPVQCPSHPVHMPGLLHAPQIGIPFAGVALGTYTTPIQPMIVLVDASGIGFLVALRADVLRLADQGHQQAGPLRVLSDQLKSVHTAHRALHAPLNM